MTKEGDEGSNAGKELAGEGGEVGGRVAELDCRVRGEESQESRAWKCREIHGMRGWQNSHHREKSEQKEG